MRRAPLMLFLVLLRAQAEERWDWPFPGIVHITRSESEPRPVNMHIVKISLGTPGLAFRLTGPGGSRETVRETTLEFARRERAQVAINAHFFVPYPSADRESFLVGLAASNGQVYSDFEKPEQSYAIVANAPAINIDRENMASIVRRKEDVLLWNAFSGSAQIITDGARTIPVYAEPPGIGGLLTPGGPMKYGNAKSWYGVANARTIIGLADRNRTLVLFTADRAGGSQGMRVGEAADLLIRDYSVEQALNMDGGGSVTLVIAGRIVNSSSDNPEGRAVASNLGVFIGP